MAARRLRTQYAEPSRADKPSPQNSKSSYSDSSNDRDSGYSGSRYSTCSSSRTSSSRFCQIPATVTLDTYPSYGAEPIHIPDSSSHIRPRIPKQNASNWHETELPHPRDASFHKRARTSTQEVHPFYEAQSEVLPPPPPHTLVAFTEAAPEPPRRPDRPVRLQKIAPPPRPSSVVIRHRKTSVQNSVSKPRLQKLHANGSTMQWIDDTRDASYSSWGSSAAVHPATITDTPSQASKSILPPGGTPLKSSIALVFELWTIIQDEDWDIDTCDSSRAVDNVGSCWEALNSPPPMTDGSGSSGSSVQSSISNSMPIGGSSKSNLHPSRRAAEREDDGEETPRKKRRQDHDPSTIEALLQPSNRENMSCPLLESGGCQGTNTTISELMRSLMGRHRIVICKECCTRLPIQDDEKRPHNVLQKHNSEGCEPRCIGNSCTGGDLTAEHMSPHRRTEKCPSWASITKATRWKFIWTLVNADSNSPPDPEFSAGPAFEHSTHKRPCKQQTRARGAEICANLMEDIKAKEKRISTLEHDLDTLSDRYAQLQKQRDEKTSNLENIIETLLECTSASKMSIPRSLQKRLHTECPSIMAEISVGLTQTHTFPTPGCTPESELTKPAPWQQSAPLPPSAHMPHSTALTFETPTIYHPTPQRNDTASTGAVLPTNTLDQMWGPVREIGVDYVQDDWCS